jgi:hypothetical protein
MKITKATVYKKPIYALGVAAMITATMTGCGQSEDVDLAGATTVYEDPDKDVQLAGDVAIDVDIEPEYDDPIELDGDVAICVDGHLYQLDGVIEMPIDDDTETSKQPAPSEDEVNDEVEDEAEDKDKAADEVVYIPILEYGDHLVLDGGVSIDDPYGN